jgi:hypothetical protein
MIIKEEADVTVLNWMVIKPDTESNKMRQLANLPDSCWLQYNLYPLFVLLHDEAFSSPPPFYLHDVDTLKYY